MQVAEAAGVIRCYPPCGGPPVHQLQWFPPPCVCQATAFGQPFVQPLAQPSGQVLPAQAPRGR